MSPQDRDKLISRYLAALSAEHRVLADYFARTSNANISDRSLGSLFDELDAARHMLPDLVPELDKKRYFSHRHDTEAYYNTTGLLALVGNAVARLKDASEGAGATPITQTKTFAYVSDAALREILQRDYQEIQRAFISQCYKSVIILCGGAIEAILLSAVSTNRAAALASAKAPSEKDFTRWDLATLIDVASDVKLISTGAHKLSDPVRGYRNLVHPGVELRQRLKFGQEEARIAIEVLHIVDRDLT